MSPRKFDRYMLVIGAGRNRKLVRLTDSERCAHFLGVLSLAAQSPRRGYLLISETEEAGPEEIANEAGGGVTVKVASSALEKLERLGILEYDEGVCAWFVHDWWDINPEPRNDPSNAERQAKHRARNAPRNGKSNAPVTHQVTQTEVEVEVEVGSNSNSTVERGSTGVGRRVFDAWVVSTDRTTQTAFDAKRQRIIANALKIYPVADLLDAVDGWRFSAHHRGENANARVYNDLGLLLRDADHIETFRDLKRGAAHLNGQRDGISELDRERLAAVNRIIKGEESA